MKFGLALSLLVLLSCATTPVTTEYMIISPKTVTFDHALNHDDTARTVSITHSCTCPFSWTSDIHRVDTTDTLAWITFPHDTVGDHGSIPIAVHPWEMPKDTNYALVAINSNSYGSDTIHVIAIR